MKLEVAGILALGAILVGSMILSSPKEECSPVELIRYVRSEPEIHVREVEKIVEKPAVCQPAVKQDEATKDEPVRRHRRRHWRRWR